MHFFRPRSQSPTAPTVPPDSTPPSPPLPQQSYGHPPSPVGAGAGAGATSTVNSARSLAGAASATPPHSGRQSPLPTPVSPAASPTAARAASRASSVTPPPGSHAASPRHLVKRIESHVRLTSHMEHIATSSTCTAVRLRVPGAAPAAAAEGPSGLAGEWTQPFMVTRVHRGGSTQRFYQEVVAPCVMNSIAGQSYTFLLNGPMESGRSQTMYGSPHHSEMGLVELTAMDLLQRAADRRAAAAAAAAAAAGGGGGGGGGPNGGATAPEETLAALSGITITYSSFLVRGAQITETVATPPPPPPPLPSAPSGSSSQNTTSTSTSTAPALSTVNAPVDVVAFPPPLGLVPMARMKLLETARESVVLPEKKHSDTSCVIQFHIYAPVDLSGTRSMATITFIDVAAIKPPLCREVDHLLTTIRRAASASASAGGPPPAFRETALTCLLEPSLTSGATTLVNITMISGRPDLFDAACAALQLAADVARLHQVLLLTHIRPPRWVFEAGQSLEGLLQRQQAEAEAHYAQGVYRYFETVQSWLHTYAGEGERLAAQLARETEGVREHLQMEVSQRGRDILSRMDDYKAAAGAAAERALDLRKQREERQQRLDALLAETQQLQQQAHHAELQVAHRIAAIRLDLSTTEASRGLQKQEATQHQKSIQMYEEKAAEMMSAVRRLSEDMQAAGAAYVYARDLVAVRRKRQRLEEELVAVSRVASQRTEQWTGERQRRKKVARLQGVEARVQALLQLEAEQQAQYEA